MNRKEYAQFDKYFEYAQILASRMIIEMMSHNIPTIEGLNQVITETGFGNRGELSDEYQPRQVNIVNWMRVSAFHLGKPKITYHRLRAHSG